MPISSATLLVALLLGAAPDYEPTTDYTVQNCEGWSVYVNNRLLNDESELFGRAQKVLAHKLFDINRVIPRPALEELHKVPLWLELDNDDTYPCACYHVSRDWLRQNGFNPDKERAVEISNAARFIRWTHSQPWVILHELAHAYHHRVLGYDDERIVAAYQRALNSGRYEEVLRYSGVRERHYGLNNEREYFAESTEAYFGINDYFPFVRAELLDHDAGMHRLLEEIWGKPPNAHDPVEVAAE